MGTNAASHKNPLEVGSTYSKLVTNVDFYVNSYNGRNDP